ncbi:unnamed protein product [Gongylonema pulchrum]|uniref:Ovule protein n=1 Tax=Gongylonema pulchrum TaxID=637853 RepID=A0A183CV06_9BILA|nr:unnamed protein product [Gongylonema pulchrum]
MSTSPKRTTYRSRSELTMCSGGGVVMISWVFVWKLSTKERIWLSTHSKIPQMFVFLPYYANNNSCSSL